jgi:glycosyl hydrolase family 123
MSRMRVLCVAVAVMIVVSLCATLAPGADTKVPGTAKDVLTRDAMVRWRLSWRTPTVPADKMKGNAPGVLPVERVPFSNRPGIQNVRIDPPAADWNSPGYDATDWPRSPVRRFSSPYYQTGAVFIRSTFNVADPKAVKALYLSLAYRGGVMVYLNGEEVARGHMPKGAVTADGPAAPYPDDAWVDEKGKLLPKEHYIRSYEKKGQAEIVRRLKSRNRALGPVVLPGSKLKKGVNLLAISLHRADYHPVALTWFNQRLIHNSWRPIQLRSISLKADGGQVVGPLVKPAKTTVWNLDIHDRIGESVTGDPNEGLRPIRIEAARNGTFNAALAVSSGQPLPAPAVTVSDLAHTDGKAKRLPASAVTVLHPRVSDGATRFGSWKRARIYDALTAKPDAKARSTRPLWLQVRVPADAAPGEYRGVVTVQAKGLAEPVKASLVVRVADWALPDPLKFRTHVGIYQSPQTLATTYKVPMWSEQHWKLVEKSFEQLARVGNDLLNVHVAEKTQFGNEQGYIYWVKQPDGSWGYDFTVLDRLLALAKKHYGTPRFVVLQIWHAGGWSHRAVDSKNTVTVLDPKTGKHTSLQVPVFGTPESKKFWTHALTAIRARLAKFGMDDSRAIGILSDSTAPAAVLGMFNQIDPKLGWMRGCHSANRATKPYRLRGGGVVVLHEHCYGMSVSSPQKRLEPVWALSNRPAAAYFRSDFDPTPPRGFRTMAERAIYQGKRGVGRVCFDFWDSVKDRKKRRWADIYNRYPESTCSQRRPTVMKLSWAAPDGPVATIRYELMLEGLQEAEAMIVIAEAASKQAGKLGAELTAKCKELWIDRINMARVVNGYSGPATWDFSGWKDQSARVYATAAEVAAALKK